ncbi:hypothetical protein MRX96_044995 [Rhipicephalus microplus]
MLDGQLAPVTVVTASPSLPATRPTLSCPALLLSGPAARRTRRHESYLPEFREGSSSQAASRSCPFWLPGTTPLLSDLSPGLWIPLRRALHRRRPLRRPRREGWFRSTSVFTPCRPGATTPADPGWGRSLGSVRRHVEFEHSVRVNDRIYVCTMCISPLTSRPSYHRCLATATLVPSTEAPRRRCSVCDATFTSARGLANHLRCQGTLDATSTRLGHPAPLVRARLPGVCTTSAVPPTLRPPRVPSHQQRPGLRDASDA